MDLSKLLETYSLSDIIEYNDLTEEEVLEFLLREKFLKLKMPLPVDCIYD